MHLRFAISSCFEEYAREKVKDLAAKFNHGELKHVEPNVKTDVEGERRNIARWGDFAIAVIDK